MFRTTFTTASLLCVALLCICSTVVSAKDISNEQRNAYEARETYNKKKSAHADLVKRISQQEKRLVEEQARLDKLKAEEQSAKAAVDQAKTDLENKVDALNAVWHLRNK